MDIPINEVNPAKYNPRKINEEARRSLKVSMDRFKDISGIVYNAKTKTLIGGHHRWNELKEKYKDLTIEHLKDEFYSISDLNGFFTGYLMRVVEWDKSEEKVANITANTHTVGGEWDLEVLPHVLEEIYEYDDTIKNDLNLGKLELDLGIQFNDWDSDLGGVDKHDPNDDGITKTIKVKTEPEYFDQMKLDIQNFLNEKWTNKTLSIE